MKTIQLTLAIFLSAAVPAPAAGWPIVEEYTNAANAQGGISISPPGQARMAASVVHDLTPLHDATRVLVNPHKGWYHHYPDNHINKYEIARDADLLGFPGMDHLYIRLAWAYLEPKEGQYDWALIDRLIEKWTTNGLGIAFRISCKETSTDRIEQQFATPRWVLEAGAKGGYYRMGKATGPDCPWEVDYGDLIFLAKLDKFLAAFAARYDGKPWLRYVDIGSIGDWGEGHAWAGSRKSLSFAVRKEHVDLHLKYFKRTQLVISDDYVHALPAPAERESLHRHILTNGISYRDDSIMVDGYFSGTSDRFTVQSPEFFAGAYPRTPTVLELEHYRKVKSAGNWEPRPGSAALKFGKGKTGPDFFRGAIDLLHATYIGYHGYAREWLDDNPELTKELLNKCGYWLFPKSVELPDKLVAGSAVPLTLTMENRGVAPPYAPYELRVKLSGAGTNRVQVLAKGCKSWLPGQAVSARFEFVLPADLKSGDYALSLGLFDVREGQTRPVEFALKESARDSKGYYRVASMKISSSPTLIGSPAADGLVVYPSVPGLAASEHYRVRVRSARDGSQWQSAFAWETVCKTIEKKTDAYFDTLAGWTHTYVNFETAGAVEIEIARVNGQPIRAATVHPLRKASACSVKDGKVLVRLDKPCLVAVDIDGQMDGQDTGKGYQGPPIHTISIFANPPLVGKPKPDDPGVLTVKPGETPPSDGPWTMLYFLPGVHDVGLAFPLHANRQYYIPGDAMVYGALSNRKWGDGHHIRIFGLGTLSGARLKHPKYVEPPPKDHGRYRPIEVIGTTDTRVEGLTIADSATHSLMLVGPYKAGHPNEVRWTKIFTWRANGDGINPFGNTLIEDCFIRTQDDSLYVNGLGIRRTVLWNDANGSSFVLSALPQLADRQLVVEDCDVIYARAKWHHWSGGRVFNMRGEGGRAAGAGVIFRNINIEDPRPTLQQFFICMNVPQPYTKDGGKRAAGDLSGILFQNISIAAPSVLGEPQILWGQADARIRHLTFENLTLAGRLVRDAGFFKTNEFVGGLIFAPSTGSKP